MKHPPISTDPPSNGFWHFSMDFDDQWEAREALDRLVTAGFGCTDPDDGGWGEVWRIEFSIMDEAEKKRGRYLNESEPTVEAALARAERALR